MLRETFSVRGAAYLQSNDARFGVEIEASYARRITASAVMAADDSE
jgi:hypothetical protein